MQPNAVTSTRALRLLAGYFRQEWKVASLGVGLLIISSVSTVYGPRFLGGLVDSLRSGDSNLAFTNLALLATIEAVRIITSGTSTFFLTVTGQKALHQLRVDLMRHLYKLPVPEIQARTPGALVSHLTNDVGALTELFSSGFVGTIERLLIVVGIVAMILTLNFHLGVIVLGSFVLLFAVGAILTAKLHTYYQNLRVAAGDVQQSYGEAFSGIPTIRLFGLHASRQEILNKTSAAYTKAQLRPAWAYAAFHPLITLVNSTSMALLIWIGGHMVLAGEISYGALVAMSSYILWLFWPIMHIVDRWNLLLSGSAAAQRVFSLLAATTELDTAGAQRFSETTRGAINFSHVQFSYTPENPLFKDLTLSIPAGERIAVVGATGSGKTTLVNLLLKLWEISAGEIRIDGVETSELGATELRKKIGLIEQDLFLFSGSVRDNITLFDSGNADLLAAISRDLPALPQLDADIDEHGRNLSMGERQLISLARALYVKPEIVILDEATAHLDPILDRQLQEITRKLIGKKTTIIIAHRLSSVTEADRIFVLHHGDLAESGTHTELMAAGGIYSKLYQIEIQEQRGLRQSPN